MMKDLVLNVTWILVHFIFHIGSFCLEELRWAIVYVKDKVIASCIPSSSPLVNQGLTIHKTMKDLRERKGKIPMHVGIVVFGREPLRPFESLWINVKMKIHRDEELKGLSSCQNTVDLTSLAKLLCWTWIANIATISLYDYKGFLKANYKQLLRHVYEECSHQLWVVRDRTKNIPVITFHSGEEQEYSNGYHKNGFTNGSSEQETLHIYLFSSEDGQKAIVNICKNMNDVEASSITETMVDKRLNGLLNFHPLSKTEPDLLLVMGEVASTVGFLPWHIRLTEIHWLPSLGRIRETDFAKSLTKFANCQQRFGT